MQQLDMVTAMSQKKGCLLCLEREGLMIFDLPEAGGSSSAVGEIDNIHLVLCEF